MRLLCTLQNPTQAKLFSDFLKSHGIENQLDTLTEKDWGSDDYGNVSAKIWVIDEDQVDAAQKWYAEFESNPDALSFQNPTKIPEEPVDDAPIKRAQKRVEEPLTQGVGRITFFFLMLCTLLLFYGMSTTPAVTKIPADIPASPLLTPPVNKKLMYDYPKAFEIVDRVIQAYGLEKTLTPSELPSEGQILLQKARETPYWQGFYGKLVTHLQNKEAPWNFNSPLFEKIRQGQFWRVFTPAVLHADIFHLLFNMLWLLVIGKQMERKMGGFRYLLFILLTGIFSNTAQYLMGGPNFIGFSGILCAMIAFVWVRQRKAAWEDYQIAPSTFVFIALFIGLLAFVQAASFFFEVYTGLELSPGMANTAHLSGAFIGWLFGHFDFFSRKL